MGRAPCCLTWGQTMVEVMKIMVTSFKRSHARTAALSAPDSAAGHRWPTPPSETLRHSRASLGQVCWLQDGGVKGCALNLLLRELQNYNSLLNNCRQKNVGSHQKKIPHIQGQRRSPSKTVGGAKSHLESNPIPARDTLRALTNLVCTRTQRPHRHWARTVSEYLLRGYGLAVACCRGREPPQLTQDWGNRLLEGTIKTLCAPGPRRKEQTPQETSFTIPE